jgi:hypothetical protein
MTRRLIALAFVLAGANTAIADDMKMPINSSDLKWGPAPATLPKGAEITVLSGDPSKDGPFVLRLKMPSGLKFPRIVIQRPKVLLSYQATFTSEWATNSMRQRQSS